MAVILRNVWENGAQFVATRVFTFRQIISFFFVLRRKNLHIMACWLFKGNFVCWIKPCIIMIRKHSKLRKIFSQFFSSAFFLAIFSSRSPPLNAFASPVCGLNKALQLELSNLNCSRSWIATNSTSHFGVLGSKKTLWFHISTCIHPTFPMSRTYTYQSTSNRMI